MASHDAKAARDEVETVLADGHRLIDTTRALRRIARAVVGDQAADDVVQTTWLEVLQRRRPGHGPAWLRSLVRSRAIDAVRRRSREPRSSDAETLEHMASQDDRHVERLEVQRLVLAAVESLDEPYRRTVCLRYFDGLGPAAIATREAVPEKTVKSRLTRAHHQLREHLGRSLRRTDGRWASSLVAFARIDVRSAAPTAAAMFALVMKKFGVALIAIVVLVVGWQVGSELRSGRAAGPESAAAGGADPTQLAGRAAPAAASVESEVERRTHVPTTAGPLEVDPDPGGIGSLLVSVIRRDGSPVEGVHVIVTCEHDTDRLRSRERARTDELGQARFLDLRPGPVRVESDRAQSGIEGDEEVRPGETAAATITLDTGVRVRGLVRDGAGRPVAGAEIWLASDAAGWTGGGVVSTTDGSGRFEVLHVPDGQSFGAIAHGFQPSSLVDLDGLDTRDGAVNIEFVLAAGGARLAGTVHDADGALVEGALVAVGSDSGRLRFRADGSIGETWTPRTAQTDAQGRFALAGLRAGSHPVQVRAHGHALWSTRVELSAGDTRVLHVALARGARVRGQVTDEAGRVVPRTLVLAFHEPLKETYLQHGQVDEDLPLDGPAAVAAEDGTFELAGLAPGETFLYAIEPPMESDDPFAVLRHAKTTLVLAEAGERRWDPVLESGRTIEGRALYRDGVPMAQSYVSLLGPAEGERHVVHSEDGSFRFLNLGEGPYRIVVQPQMHPLGEPEPSLESVVPGGLPVEVVAAFDSPAEAEPAIVRVRVVDERGQVLPDAATIAERVDGRGSTYGRPDGEGWRFRLLDPGAYRPLALMGERTVCTGEPFDVHGGEDMTLPDLVVGPGGTLIVVFERAASPVPTGLRAFLRRGTSRRAEEFDVGGRTELRIDGLEPGPGKLSVYGDNVQQLVLTFEIDAGAETVVHAPLVPAVRILYRIEWPHDEPGGTLSIRFVDRSSGEEMDGYEVADLTRYSSPIVWSTYLPIGSYTFEVLRDGEPHHRQEFEVESLDPALAPELGPDGD